MTTLNDKRKKELSTIRFMIELYCRKLHTHRKGQRCDECEALFAYATKRIERCPFMETKTFCSTCKVHCYEPHMREKIRIVMRFSGPRMMLYHPLMALRHVYHTMKENTL